MKKYKDEALLKLLHTLFVIVMKEKKRYVLLAMFISTIVGTLTVANVLVKEHFFDGITEAATNMSIERVIWLGVFMCFFMISTLILQGVSDILLENLGWRMQGSLGKEVNKKMSKIDPICFENTEMLEDINKAYHGVEKSSEIIKIIVTNISFYVPYFLFFALYLYNIHPLLCVCMLLCLIPAFGGQFLRTGYYSDLEDTVSPIRRQKDYYERCIVDKEYAKETRLLGAVWFFRNIYETKLFILKREQWKTEKKSAFIELGLRLFSLVFYCMIVSLLYYFLHIGHINTSAFVAVFTSIDQIFNYMDTSSFMFGDIAKMIPLVQNTMGFLQLPERSGALIEIKSFAVSLRDVSFRYPNRSNSVIKNINLDIKEGETIAIIGDNGAGKSTLVKLIMGLYTPSEGKVYIGGYSSEESSMSSLFSSTSAVFQKFQRYKMKLNENIMISSTKREVSLDMLKHSLKSVELDEKSRSFPEGLDTMLTREFNGVDLSGGQWQRIAIARGLYRSHHMIILDEPTAAIDPIEETRIYTQFASISRGKTAIIVTHRLGSAKIAERIIVMRQGEIVDIGSHEQLLSKEGVYKDMYQAQAKWYE